MTEVFAMLLMNTNVCDEIETTEEAGAERRRGLRIKQTRPVKIFDQMSSRYFGGQTCDISSTGLKLELPLHASIREGETLNVHVGLSADGGPLANRRQMMPARVVWVNRSAASMKTGRMTAGVEFLSTVYAHRDAA
jgi:hypothetical protein